MIIGGIVVIIVWNNRLFDYTKISSSFYTSKSRLSNSASASQSNGASEEKPAESQPAESSSAAAGGTTTVEAGEGLYAIAARTGVDAQTIAKANGMTVENWYANPGDVVKLKWI